MIAKLRSALSLPPRDWWLLIQAWVLLLAVDLGLRWLPFHRLQAWVDHFLDGISKPAELVQARQVIQRTRRMVEIARRHHLYPMTCLRHALALQWMLARQGVRAELRFGVNRQGGDLKAHAWLEYGGVPIGEPEMITEHFALLTPAG
jgi:hypothetical protein